MTPNMCMVGLVVFLRFWIAVADAEARTAAAGAAAVAEMPRTSTSVAPRFDPEKDCNKWLDGRDFYGDDLIPGGIVDNRAECFTLCRSTPGCNGVTYVVPEFGSTCWMKNLDVATAMPTGDAKTVTLMMCEDGPNVRAEDIPLQPNPNPLFGAGHKDKGECGQWFDRLSFDGEEGDMEGEEVSEELTKEDCLRRCFDTSGCNGASYNFEFSSCHIKSLGQQQRGSKDRGSSALRICPPGSKTAECGKWLKGKDLFQGVLVEDSGITLHGEGCLQKCRDTPNCNAVVFKPITKQCWLKDSLPDDVPLLEPESDSYSFCVEDTDPSGKSKRTVAVIAVSVAAAVALVLAATAMFRIRYRGARSKREQHAEDPTSTNLEHELPVDVKEHITQLEVSSAASKGTGKAVNSTTDSSGAHVLVRVLNTRIPNKQHMTSTMVSTSEMPSTYCFTPYRDWGNDRHLFIQAHEKMHTVEVTTTSVSGGLGAAVCTPGTALCSLSPSVTCMPVPHANASKEEVMEFLHNQLDRIELCSDGHGNEVLGGLILLGSVSPKRLQGGQAIVQMAQHKNSKLEYAIKFFVVRSAFLKEKALYVGESPITQFLPQVRNIEDNENGTLVDTAGYPLPPCIVMERGESLDLYSRRNAPDRATVFVVIYHIAQRLVELHAMGYVHRDLKPANVMWLPRANRWTVIDFGCVATKGDTCPVACTLRYAAPEVIAAKRSGHSIVVHDSQDAWSLGVMAFEMISGTSTFPTGLSREMMMDQIEGVNGEMLPWEGDRLAGGVRAQLRLFKGTLLQLLHREPSQRPSMQAFCRTCAHVLGEGATTTSPPQSYRE